MNDPKLFLKRSLTKLRRNFESCPCSRPTSPTNVINDRQLSKSEGLPLLEFDSDSAETFSLDNDTSSQPELPSPRDSEITKPLFILPREYKCRSEIFNASHPILSCEGPKMTYTSGYGSINNSTSFVMTSAISIIRFLTYCSAIDKTPFSLVIANSGATNNYYKMIPEMFPLVKLIDIWSTSSTSACYPSGIRSHKGVPIREYYDGRVVFINDHVLAFSVENMISQAKVFESLQPEQAMLNLQLPHPSKSSERTMTYYDGIIVAVPYAFGLSSDTKLYTSSTASKIEYDIVQYDGILFYHNIITRNSTHFTLLAGDCSLYDEILLQPISSVPTDVLPLLKGKTQRERSEIYRTFDFCYTVKILQEYLTLHGGLGCIREALNLWIELERRLASYVYRPFFAKI